jgi:hypothetical protein
MVVNLSILLIMKLNNMIQFWVIFSMLVSIIFMGNPHQSHAQQNNAEFRDAITIARLQYRGGGDWYNDPSALSNLINFANNALPIRINPRYDDVPVGSRDLFKYPFVFMTGHGNITMNASEIQNLRRYLERGGFLFVDDDYGMDEYIRPILKQIYPDEDLIDLPFSHPVFNQAYRFANGIPKVHEHDNKPAQLFGLYSNGRLVALYGYESNISDGWADADIHGVSAETREQSLRMGANILMYIFTTNRILN